jgi:hypothetical protein
MIACNTPPCPQIGATVKRNPLPSASRGAPAPPDRDDRQRFQARSSTTGTPTRREQGQTFTEHVRLSACLLSAPGGEFPCLQ